jgi:guanylate kinase
MKRVILIGRAGTGKDFARKCLQEVGFDFQISYTTRPIRPGEVHGQDYFFVSEDEFDQLTQQDAWHEHVVFNNWHYGTLKTQFEGKNRVFIMSPAGLSHLTSTERAESLVVYLNVVDKGDKKETTILETRLKQRGWSETQIQVRMQADDQQFSSFVLQQPGLEITDPFFPSAQLVSQILSIGKFRLSPNEE